MNRFTGALLVLGLLATPTFSQSLEVRDADIDASLIVRLAERVFVPPALEDRGISLKRDDVTGSWSLRALTCPDNTITCGSARATKACCAKGYNCASRYYAWACCPTKDQCDQTAATFPRCSDPSWTLWKHDDYDTYFCCLSDQKGYVTTNGGGACGAADLKIDPSVAVSTATPVGGGGGGGTATVPPTSNPTDSVSTSISVGTSTSVPTVSSSVGTSSGLATDTSHGTGTKNSSPTDTSSNNKNNTNTGSSKSGLATGAIIGIVVGAIVVLALFVVGIFWAMKKGRQSGTKEALALIAAQNQQMAQQQQQQQQQPFQPTAPAYQSSPGTPSLGPQQQPYYDTVKPVGAAGPQADNTPPPNPMYRAHEADSTSVLQQQQQQQQEQGGYNAGYNNGGYYPAESYAEMEGQNRRVV